MKFYLIPAYEETVEDQGYEAVIDAATKKGFDIKVLDLQIQHNDFEELINEAAENIKKTGVSDSAIFGFSTGALIAYQISTKIAFEKAYFCSISPLLNGDIPKTDRLYVRSFGSDTVRGLKRIRYGISLAKEQYFFFGANEGRKLPKRTTDLTHKNNGELTIVENNDHELNGDYVKAIISRL